MSERRAERRGLGRGLSALMADVGMMEQSTGRGSHAPGVREVPIEKVHPNPDQPRRIFDKDALEDLSNSIREKGVLQPLLVREVNGSFEIVAGERRWRASQLARLHTLPVIVREYSDTEVLEVAIIENIQRADLSAVEEAQAYKQLIDRFGHTQDKVAESLGKSRSYIANSLRLLSLPEDVVELIENGSLSSGHARALVALENASTMARRIVDKGMSVREVERLVREGKTGKGEARKYAVRSDTRDDDTVALEADISGNLGMAVRIRHEPNTGAGTVTIAYNSLEELDRLCGLLSQIPAEKLH
ncbi:ParB/RepB/Spo0J family partition protein [Falsigemmobacter faecalis]|uniref:ParB/RepB/Spo0J family partition protein n=1 Tax=Falsigemmobacter faecalis TaxID=2488730 RepID=A0A3P3DVV5_9RHOB|nr:ParB/RepB/Spo0J family partition protein [Falsigemmobacter faecalis]RRH77876.1 ParB/RepB/Spo0J family partition protein [Falsigemmobacter faecalis]